MSDDEVMRVRREVLERLFDAVTNSMEFGSGLLETDDVMCMREVADLLGVDPMKGTPYEFAKRIKHPIEPQGKWSYCRWCSLDANDPIHDMIKNCARCGQRPELIPDDCLECEREEPVSALVGDDEIWSPSTKAWHPVLYVGDGALILRKPDGTNSPKLKFPSDMTFKVRPGKARRAMAALYGAGLVESTREDDAR